MLLQPIGICSPQNGKLLPKMSMQYYEIMQLRKFIKPLTGKTLPNDVILFIMKVESTHTVTPPPDMLPEIFKLILSNWLT